MLSLAAEAKALAIKVNITQIGASTKCNNGIKIEMAVITKPTRKASSPRPRRWALEIFSICASPLESAPLLSRMRKETVLKSVLDLISQPGS